LREEVHGDGIGRNWRPPWSLVIYTQRSTCIPVVVEAALMPTVTIAALCHCMCLLLPPVSVTSTKRDWIGPFNLVILLVVAAQIYQSKLGTTKELARERQLPTSWPWV
jgi:hypothetical protein